MANTVRLKRSAVEGKAPVVGDLSLGELAVNTYDGKLYTKKNDGVDAIVEIGAGGGLSAGDANTFTAEQTFNVASIHNGGLTVDGPYRQVVEPLGLGIYAINLSIGNYFTKSVQTNSTFTFINPPPAGTVGSFTLEVDHQSGNITWPASVYWDDNLAPTLTWARTHLFMFVTIDGGTTYHGSVLKDYAA